MPPYGTRTDTIVAIDFTKKMILIGNSSCAGEMKKSVFTTDLGCEKGRPARPPFFVTHDFRQLWEGPSRLKRSFCSSLKAP